MNRHLQGSLLVVAVCSLFACSQNAGVAVSRSAGAASAASPVLVLPLEEGAGSVAADTSGLGNHGSTVGNPQWAQGGLVLNGNDHVLVPPSASLGVTQLTLAAWIKPTIVRDWATVISYGTTVAPYAMQMSGSGMLRFTAEAGTPQIAFWDSSAGLAVDRWQHVAVTYDGTALRFYIDGVLDSNQPTAAITFSTISEPLTVGTQLLLANSGFEGALRDVRVYDGALSEAEVAAMASDRSFVPQPIGAFLNGVLPTRKAGLTGIVVTPAFPALTFDDPLFVRPAPNSNRLCVGSRQGVIHSFVDDPLVATKDLFLDLSAHCAEVWDGGLLGLAFHPEFGVPESPNRGYCYVYYCYTPDGDYPKTPTKGFFNCYLRLSRFTVPDGTMAADPASEAVMIHLRLYNDSHRSGDVAFGPDGYLYVPIGEQFRYDTAQRLDDNLEGGIARIDVDLDPVRSHPPRRTMPLGFPEEISGQHYWIPNDNPFLDPNGTIFEEWFSIGHRNPHRMTFDPTTGRLWSGEIGEDTREEVNVIEKGHNYGWPFREGLIVGPWLPPPTVIGIVTDPVLDFVRTEANAIIGGYVYHGTRFPNLIGHYICGDYSQNRIFALDYDEQSGTASRAVIGEFTPGSLASFGLDHQGELYLCGLGKGVPLYGLTADDGPDEPPALLSQTGAFADLQTLEPAAGFVPYGLNAPFWSDGALKHRWIAIPNDGVHDSDAETVVFEPTDNWTFPVGTVAMKHFELPIDECDPSITRRLETRLLVVVEKGFYGLTYRWRADGSDADLLTDGMQEDILIRTASGSRTQTWTYPSRIDCLNCHQAAAGGLLGPRTHQLNGVFDYPSGPVNQLRAWNRLGMFRSAVDTRTIPSLPRSAAFDDPAASLEHRARSYLDSNCSSCHRPGTSNRALFDARLTTQLAGQGLLRGSVLNDLGIPGATLLTPHDPDTSISWRRLAALDNTAMPPLAKNVLDQPGVETIRQWIWSLPASTQAVSLGHSIDPLPNYDAWWHTMIVDKEQTYTNTTGSALDLRIANFRFQVIRPEGGEVTPFLVRVLGDDDFIVAAVGTPRTALEYRVGPNVFPFHDDGDVVITLQAGETLAAGFLDALPDGSGGGEAGVIPYCSCNGTNEVWSTGGWTPADSGKVAVGLPPTPGPMTVIGNRMYSFAIDLCGCPPPSRLRLGNETDEQISEDAWSSNLVINETDTLTNDGWQPQQFAIESFAFHARRLGDPVTPFVARINGDGDFTVLAIGTTRTAAHYVVGANRFVFDADGPVALVLGPGETIAAGFIDAAADGSGGGAGAVVPFALGGDAVWHSGGPAGTDSGSLTVGQPPQPGTSGPLSQARDYAFAVGIRRGADGTALTIGEATHTGQLQLDPWQALTVISRTGIYTNSTTSAQRIDVDRFRFRAESTGGLGPVGPVTPFVVKVRGHSDFLVVAIGTTRDERDYGTGDNDLPFREGGNAEIILGPGERLAPGFISARPDGSGAHPCVIPFVEGGAAWLTGGTEASDTGRVRHGWPPLPGKLVLAGGRRTGANGFDTFGLAVLRDYCFEIGLDLRP